MVNPIGYGRRRAGARACAALPIAITLAAALAASACTPEIPDTTTLVSGPRLLGARATPAEARPGEAMALEALDVAPTGAAGRALEWAICTARAPLTAAGTLNPGCLATAGPDLVPLGAGAGVTGAMPRDVCSTFGPSQPPPRPGQPAGRPADPDSTGGFYQPIRLRQPDLPEGRAYASFEVRALCNPGGLTPEQLSEFGRRYRPNSNPTIVAVTLGDGTPVAALETAPEAVTEIPAGMPVTLRVAWPACPGPGEDACGDGVCGAGESVDGCADDCAAPRGCGGAESFLWFDPTARAFSLRRETMTVSWFATGGQLATARTGRTEDEAAARTDSDNLWTAPATPADVRLWVVLRDARGGSAWSSHLLRVR